MPLFSVGWMAEAGSPGKGQPVTEKPRQTAQRGSGNGLSCGDPSRGSPRPQPRHLLDFGMVVESFGMGWLKDHVFIAAWCSPTITLVSLVVRNTIRPAEKVNWSMIILYVAFLTCLAAVLTPGVDPFGRGTAMAVGVFTLGTITKDALSKG